MKSATAAQFLPAADDRVGINGVELHTVAAPAGAFGGDQRRAAAEKGVEHDVAAGRAVEDRVSDHRHRLDGRMQRQQIAFLATACKGAGAGIAPNIAAIAAKLAKLDVVAVPLAAAFEDEDKLVLAAVERPHPGIVLDPDNEVFQLAIYVRPAASSSSIWRQSMQR